MINGKYFLIIIDSFTKWLEVFECRNLSTEITIEKFREHFSRFGIPTTVVSDNGTAFTSHLFKEFISKNSIKHLTIAPYNSQSNGQAENSVKTVKTRLYALMNDPNNLSLSTSTLLARFLLIYRNTPHCSTNISPAKLVFGRSIRTRLDFLKKPEDNVTHFQSNDSIKLISIKVRKFSILRLLLDVIEVTQLIGRNG